MLGKFGTLRPRYARATSPHSSLRPRPSRPAISIGATKSWLAKPVARTIASAGRSTPAASRIPLALTASTLSATSSTLGSVSVGYHSSVSMIRLQPNSSLGVTLRRSSGRLSPS